MLLDPQARSDLRRRLEEASRRARRESATGALAYLHHVVIDRAGEPCLFREAAEPWQWLLASRVIPAVDAVAGVRPGYSGPRSFWFTMPRGHDKTSLIGRLCSWLLAFSRQGLRMVAAAADRDQAGLIADFMQAEARLNPWLQDLLKFATWRVDGASGSKLRILSADAFSSYGLKEDVLILDELTHWVKRDLFDAVVSGREKRPGSVMIVITNAGLLNTWQHEVYQVARSSPNWYTYEAPGQLAGWMSKDKIDELRRLVPPALAKRLYDNRWLLPGEENGFVTPGEAGAAVDPGLSYQRAGVGSKRPYYAAIDYGPVRDRTVMCVLHWEDGRVVVDRMDVHQGSAERRVPVSLIEDWVVEVERAFHRPTFVVDPHNLEGSIQRFEGALDLVRFEPRAGKANYQLAANLRSLVINKQVAWYRGCGEMAVGGRYEDLTSEMAEVIVEVKPFGYRISHEGNRHDDRVVALGMAALECVQAQGRVRLETGGRWF